ncbi:formate dehydrogenase accessory sulfurtransferase FdhD [Pseudoxanthomonas sp. LH2527]|uniref:formate dehydrogenase accessory sulfurtransferase FdhD n=1 Tax=Pseudoxanthomonas sp. LH2527 TaxID=2923249 RepID=UPI001F1343C2|nr:formate dehydrogenase accessory sulfurtransferase FdhD [Pseudoxanthomonas sp. LH2527]MCH6482121.1 formate dehydrogenase accessory sulfurtransferase FdhD [Pseudoxanthomonas sp. LH2527]
MSMPADRIEGLARREVVDVTDGVSTMREDRLAEEVPLAIHCNGEPLAVMMVSPCDLEDFGQGFALTELGIAADELVAVETQSLLEGIRLDLRTRHSVAPRGAQQQRWLPGRSGCGICGQRHLEDVVRTLENVPRGRVVDPSALQVALVGIEQRQPLNAATGAIHAAAWAQADGTFVLVREDVGRHNALDKLIGAMQRCGIDAGSGFALVTSRASYEMVAKAAMAGIPLLAAMSAPTALAVDLANGCGMTLAGFVRTQRQVVYSHAWRLAAS